MNEEYSRRRILGLGLSTIGIHLGAKQLESPLQASTTTEPTTLEDGLPLMKRSFFYLISPDAPNVRSVPDKQFVFARVSADQAVSPTELPSITDFTLRVGDGVFRAGRSLAGIRLEAITIGTGLGEPYRKENATILRDGAERRTERFGKGVVGFVIPTDVTADDVAIELRPTDRRSPITTWKLDSAFGKALEQPPEMEVVDVTFPDTIQRNVRSSVSVTVRNNNGRDGVFKATLGITDAEHPSTVDGTVSAGETVTFTHPIQYPSPFETMDGQADQVTFELSTGQSSITRTVAVTDET
jgi:hypothetical protein